MTELQGHDGHDSYAYVQLRAVQRDLRDAHRTIRELQSRIDAMEADKARLLVAIEEMGDELGKDGE